MGQLTRWICSHKRLTKKEVGAEGGRGGDWSELKRLNDSWKFEECKFFNVHGSQMYVWSAVVVLFLFARKQIGSLPINVSLCCTCQLSDLLHNRKGHVTVIRLLFSSYE